VARLFFLLSGEHETLPVSELTAILEAEGYAFKVLEKLDQVLRVEANLNCIEVVKNRASLTRICVLELFMCEAEMNAIVKAALSSSLDEVVDEQESFAVRVRRVKNYSTRLKSMTLESKLGELILRKTEKSSVNLRNPDKTFVGILTADKFVFGLKLANISPKTFVERRPRKRPFFHPSAMPPKLARCMVNLAKPKARDIVLDPFCGTGSMLIEAALMNCRVLGLDIQKRMLRGTRRNMEHFKTKPEGLILADAKRLPVNKVDCVVTDPPYGRSATTLKRSVRQLVEEVLEASHGALGKGQIVCIAAPKTLGIKPLGEALGYKHLGSHFVYVHRSLTREIATLEKV
jgi:tRNA (guanine10-N2)-dimethyltransferase